MIAVGDPNAIASRKKKLSQRRSHDDRHSGIFVGEQKRKGSCDSLASQKSVESTSVPVKDTLSKAKKQIHALLRVGRKNDKWEATHQTAHSDGELEENSQNNGMTWFKEGLNRTEDVEREFKSDGSLDIAEKPADDTETDVWQSRREVQRHQVLRRGTPPSPLDPTAPTRIARKARRSPKSESSDPMETGVTATTPTRDDTVVSRTCSEPMRTPTTESAGKENIWLMRDETIFKRTTSDPTRSSYEPPKRPSDPALSKVKMFFFFLGVSYGFFFWVG